MAEGRWWTVMVRMHGATGHTTVRKRGELGRARLVLFITTLPKSYHNPL
jgi:hypothetical protein